MLRNLQNPKHDTKSPIPILWPFVSLLSRLKPQEQLTESPTPLKPLL